MTLGYYMLNVNHTQQQRYTMKKNTSNREHKYQKLVERLSLLLMKLTCCWSSIWSVLCLVINCLDRVCFCHMLMGVDFRLQMVSCGNIWCKLSIPAFYCDFRFCECADTICWLWIYIRCWRRIAHALRTYKCCKLLVPFLRVCCDNGIDALAILITSYIGWPPACRLSLMQLVVRCKLRTFPTQHDQTTILNN